MRPLTLLCWALLSAAAIGLQRPEAAQIGNGKQTAIATRSKAGMSEMSRARQLLQEAMGRLASVNVRAIIVQKDVGSNVMQQIKVEMSKGGKIHQIVLSPLSVQGTELVDDGVKTLIYSPDDRSVIEQPSARQDSRDSRFPMSLVDRNYTLRIEGKERIAGRMALKIQAVPKNDDLDMRCYAVDEKTGFLLRLETCREGREPLVHFETRVVEFPADFPENTFHMDSSIGVRYKRFQAKCVPASSGNDLTEELRFRPLIPDDLPYGFEVQDLQASADSGVPTLAVRVTDGLAKATILEWRSGGGAGRVPEGMLIQHTSRLTLLISGDLPSNVKDRILRAFVKAARERSLDFLPPGASRDSELDCPSILFLSNRDRGRSLRCFWRISPLVQD